jgi:hypothetical protein
VLSKLAFNFHLRRYTQGSVLACDFYNGGAVACLSDADIVTLLIDELLPAAVPGFKVGC